MRKQNSDIDVKGNITEQKIAGLNKIVRGFEGLADIYFYLGRDEEARAAYKNTVLMAGFVRVVENTMKPSIGTSALPLQQDHPAVYYLLAIFNCEVSIEILEIMLSLNKYLHTA